jgi:hypothetical protein
VDYPNLVGIEYHSVLEREAMGTLLDSNDAGFTFSGFPVVDDVAVDDGEPETYYLAVGEGDSQECSSLLDAFYWLGGYEGDIYIVTKQLVAKRVFRDPA